MHRSFAAWAVGGLLRESQQFSPIRSQTLMPSFVFLCSRQCSTEPPSQPRRPATRRGIFFREFRFPLLRFLRSRFSVTVMSLAFYTDIESSRVEQQQHTVSMMVSSILPGPIAAWVCTRGCVINFLSNVLSPTDLGTSVVRCIDAE